MGYFDKTTDNLYPEKIDKNEYLFIKLIDSLQNDKELFFKGMLHSESQFLSTIRQIQDYIHDFPTKSKVYELERQNVYWGGVSAVEAEMKLLQEKSHCLTLIYYQYKTGLIQILLK